jgi:chemotaxis protein methyltransferase CheR
MKTTQTNFYRFQELIEDKAGIILSGKNADRLEDALLAVIKESRLNNISELYDYLKEDKDQNHLFEHLIESLTDTKTSFFRDEGHFSTLASLVFPIIIENRKKDKKITIWSAACSAGEEPYSIAMTLHSLIKDKSDWKIEILATDISTKRLKSANSGIYDAQSLERSLSDKNRMKYFSKKGNDYILSPEIKNMVTFKRHNLIGKSYPDQYFTKSSFDLIFCRNVLIYFRSQNAQKIIDKIHTLLDGDGFLFIGGSEAVMPYYDKFKPVHFPKAYIFQKPKDTKKPNAKKAVSKTGPAKKTQTKVQTEPLFDKDEDLVKLRIGNLDDYLQHAKNLIDKDEHDKAREWCYNAIKIDKDNIEAYNLLSLIFIEKKQFSKAIQILKKAVNIDKKFVMGFYNLGNIYVKLGSMKQAKEYYVGALEILESLDPGTEIDHSDGRAAKGLTRVIRLKSGGL